ncbi:MAG: cytochrome c family protein [Candidatus Schekmanbacteria bacterium]|nr:cytochrome c family protein [Candidatus Schekmanbacteria bacterium]
MKNFSFLFFMLWMITGAGLLAAPLPVIISHGPISDENQGQWVGDQKCIPCHEKIYQEWLTSPHGRAWQKLADEKSQKNPSCLRCHTTGYGQAGGFSEFSATPQLINVQCESCHGPASRHLQKVKDWSQVKSACQECEIRRICMGCHTPKQSPDFSFPNDWKKIKHTLDK